MKRTRSRSKSLDLLCNEIFKSNLGDRDNIVSSIMNVVPSGETEEHFKWRLEYNARVITALRKRDIWPVKLQDCPWETEREETE